MKKNTHFLHTGMRMSVTTRAVRIFRILEVRADETALSKYLSSSAFAPELAERTKFPWSPPVNVRHDGRSSAQFLS